MSDIEAILNAAESKSIFPKFLPDISAPQAKLIRGYIARFRDQLARVMDGLGIVADRPALGSLHSIRVTLAFVRVAVEEMAPHHMRGYGELAESVEPQLRGLCAELEGLLERLAGALAEDTEGGLQARLERLQRAAGGVELLQVLDRIIADHGLVELRPRLSMIVERLESKRFEIAVFGRVSSGKSSLLNHILHTAVLPVGVNPITAVPTRLIHGSAAGLTVSFADRRVARLPIESLPEFVSEVHNPANTKGVVKLVAELPSERLRDGLAFVDTPGLGSLATAGAAETLAYLPQCDLGVVLISAGSPLNDEDLSTIRLLYDAAIPVKVLVSKADLLAPIDLDSALRYTVEQIRAQLGVEVDVHPVSTAPSHAHLLERWFSEEIAPLDEKHKQLAQASGRRKTAALRETVEAILKAKLNGAASVPAAQKQKLLALEHDLREAAGRLEDARVFCLRVADEIRGLTPAAINQATSALLDLWSGAAPNGTEPPRAVAAAIVKTAGFATQVHTHLRDLALILTAALQRAARALGSDDAPAEEELLHPLREMPRFDPPPLGAFHQPWILRPKALARSWIHGQLRRSLEEALSEAFATHARLVENWARQALAELQLRFDSSADAYRAQLARLMAQGTVASRGAVGHRRRSCVPCSNRRRAMTGTDEDGVDSRQYIFSFAIETLSLVPADFILPPDLRGLRAGVFLPQAEPDWFGRRKYPARILLLTEHEVVVVAHPTAGEEPQRLPLEHIERIEWGRILLTGWIVFAWDGGQKQLLYNTRARGPVEKFMRTFEDRWLPERPRLEAHPPSTFGEPLNVKFEYARSAELVLGDAPFAQFFQPAVCGTRRLLWFHWKSWSAGDLVAATSRRLLWITERRHGRYERYGTVSHWAPLAAVAEVQCARTDRGSELRFTFRSGASWRIPLGVNEEEARVFAAAVQGWGNAG